MPKLDKVLKAGYNGQKSVGNFIRDEDLSDNNQQVFYNAKKNKVLYNVNGTHSLSDVLTDVQLGLGNLKQTDRYNSAKIVYEKAKSKYAGANTTLTGHSLGGAIVNGIAKGDDAAITLDAGYTFGQKARKNVLNIRSRGDVVSTLAPKTNTVTVGQLNSNPLAAHNVDNIKRNNFRV